MVLDPLRHDGKTYRPGDTLSLTADAAVPLLGLKVLEAPADT